jgi:N-acetylneuraminate synthase
MLADKTYVIAEAGVNHNGSLELALKLVDVAASAGADAVKFQTFQARNLASAGAAKAAYQQRHTDAAESQLEMLRKLELDEAAHRLLMSRCAQQGIQFLSTPFDLESLTLLVDRLQVPRLKLSSGEITNAPLLLRAAQTGKPIILSTGMSTLGDVQDALGVLAFGYLAPAAPPGRKAFSAALESSAAKAVLRDKVVLLQCTTEYPAAFADVNLRAMETLRRTFGLRVGLSDHTPGTWVALAAVGLGAVVIEKHFTLDRNLQGPDHKSSLEPNELKDLVAGIRVVEQALGAAEKRVAPCEAANRAIARKSLVAALPIRAGDVFTAQNLACKRPGTGVSPLEYWEYLGRRARRDYAADEVIADQAEARAG